MAIAPINIARVSYNLRSFNLLESVRSSNVSLFKVQNQLATGLKFNYGSEAPLDAAAATRIERKLSALGNVAENLREVNATLTTGEAAMQDAINLVMDARSVVVEAINDTNSADERRSLGVVIDSILNELVSVGNRKHLNTYLFSGHFGDDTPFTNVGQGVLFRGDAGRLAAIVDSDFARETYTISGRDFYQAESVQVQGNHDLDPAVTRNTRLSDLNGATGLGVALGRVMVSDGSTNVEIDLAGAETVGDVLDRLNADLPDTLEAQLDARAINIVPAPPSLAPLSITVQDIPGGRTAADLGILTTTAVGLINGADLDPRLTPRVLLADLNTASGIDLSGGLTISNGVDEVTVDFTTAQTLEDVLNTINATNLGVQARIAADGKTIEVVNRTSGPALRIQENGGLAATRLGIRSMTADTPIAALNEGRGVETVDGDDFRITTASGATIDVDLDDLDLSTATLRDVIDLLNTRGAGTIIAGLRADGNGLAIRDLTAGPGTLSISKLNVSPAIDGLGLTGAAVGGELLGDDVNPVRVPGVLTQLVDIRRALDTDDTRTLSIAGERLESALEHMQAVQGQFAAKARVMLDREQRADSEATAAQIMMSDVRDADMTETVVRFQQLQVALQANLRTSARTMNLSLMDYL